VLVCKLLRQVFVLLQPQQFHYQFLLCMYMSMLLNLEPKQGTPEKNVSVVYYRVQYEIEKHVTEMQKNNFPESLIRQFTG